MQRSHIKKGMPNYIKKTPPYFYGISIMKVLAYLLHQYRERQ